MPSATFSCINPKDHQRVVVTASFDTPWQADDLVPVLASSTDLLSACKAMLPWMELVLTTRLPFQHVRSTGSTLALHMAKAAIEKAEG